MVILGSIGTKKFKKDVLVHGFPLLEYHNNGQKDYTPNVKLVQDFYQLVPGIVLMVILGSIGTKVFKKGVLVYGFPLLEYHNNGQKDYTPNVKIGTRFVTNWYKEPF